MTRSKSSARWLREHFNDPYVKRARGDGYRSRAVYKLIEINDKDAILRPGRCVVDLGAAPGSWSQYAARRVAPRGAVFALDILPMDPLPDVTFVHGDFSADATLTALADALAGRHVDLVMSDMAPNKSGIKAVDQPRSMYLCELAADFAFQTLRPGGDLLLKVFQGSGFETLLSDLRRRFGRVVTRKPKASRDRSNEYYLLARDYRV